MTEQKARTMRTRRWESRQAAITVPFTAPRLARSLLPVGRRRVTGQPTGGDPCNGPSNSSNSCSSRKIATLTPFQRDWMVRA